MSGAYFSTGSVSIILGDFREVMADMPAGSVGAVIADPPYPRKYLPLWEPLGRLSAHVLARGGSLLSIVPHYALPTILSDVGQHLKYRWLLCMDQNGGPHPRMAMGIEVAWKPIGWWVKEAWPVGRGFRIDWFSSVAGQFSELPGYGAELKLHKWQQSLAWARFCLKFVPAGELVIDPMVGAGTLLAAAISSGHPAIGIEIDEATAEIAAKRIEQLNRDLPLLEAIAAVPDPAQGVLL